ncbi:DUF3734 domain-containing protein, partial [Rhizobium ruizarguesonis]
PRQDTLAFPVALWSASGEFPRDLLGIALRPKDIRFSSRTRAATDHFKKQQRLRRALGHLVELVPQDALLQADPEIKLLVD